MNMATGGGEGGVAKESVMVSTVRDAHNDFETLKERVELLVTRLDSILTVSPSTDAGKTAVTEDGTTPVLVREIISLAQKAIRLRNVIDETIDRLSI